MVNNDGLRAHIERCCLRIHQYTKDGLHLTEPRPFGLPSIRELLRVLISLLNPHDHQHTDTMRLMALSILNVAFEVGGRTTGQFESLRNLVVDDLCKSLFQVIR